MLVVPGVLDVPRVLEALAVTGWCTYEMLLCLKHCFYNRERGYFPHFNGIAEEEGGS